MVVVPVVVLLAIAAPLITRLSASAIVNPEVLVFDTVCWLRRRLVYADVNPVPVSAVVPV